MRCAVRSRRSAVRRRPASARLRRRRRPPRPNRPRRRAGRRPPASPDTMELRDRAIALYGRFSPGGRERLQRAIAKAGGAVARDLTGRSHMLVVGALATPLIDSGALALRLRAARERGTPIMGERAFAASVAGKPPKGRPTAPLATALPPSLTRDDAEVLAAFDLIQLEGDRVGFGDQSVLRTAAELVSAGRALGEAARILARAR